VFPNAIREQRRRKGWESLLTLAGSLPHIPYIRLSKIERGEVVAKAAELQVIADVLGVDVNALLIDVDAPDFSIAMWAGLRGEPLNIDHEREELAMLLAAAFRARRAGKPELTLARLQSDFGLPAVIVSRIENAVKAPDKWNAATLTGICAVMEVASAKQLVALLQMEFEEGTLDDWLLRIPNADERKARTSGRIAALRAELAQGSIREAPLRPVAKSVDIAVHAVKLPVSGISVGDGLIDPLSGQLPANSFVVAPVGAGPRAYALRMGRATLGAALPGHAVLIVDPDRFPAQGGLAVLSEGDMLRVLAVTTDRDGRLIGHSLNPEKAVPLDEVCAADVAMVTAVLLG